MLVSPFWARDSSNRAVPAGLTAGAVTLVAVALSGVAAHAGFELPRPFYLGMVVPGFQLDPLAAWFLGVIGLVTIPVTAYIPAYMDHVKRRVDMRLFHASLGLLLLSMAAVVLASNAVTFLVAWEVMSLTSFFLVATDHQDAPTRRAALIYVAATRVGTAFLAGGFLWAHALSHSWQFSHWHLSGTAALWPGLLILVGLGVKAGMWPFHLWLPIAHPAAPAPVSALMSGVMVKVAVYMMIRLYLLPGAFSHISLGYAVLALGAISAFWGALFALLQRDLKRMLAYHTVENVGLILVGVGGSMVASHLGLPVVARIAVAGALFHVLNHAVFKSLLFLGAGSVDQGAGTLDLERLGGLGRRMPTTFACFVLGGAAKSALPPLNGFASEWLIFQGALGLAYGAATPAFRFAAMLLIGWIALVGALVLAGYVRAVGVAFLGRPRSESAGGADETPPAMYVPQVLLAGLCVLLGLIAPAVLGRLTYIVAPLEPNGIPMQRLWTLPTATLVVVMLSTLAAIALWMRSAANHRPARLFATWECGFGQVTERMQATATSFAQPIARMFGVFYAYDVHRQIEGEHRRLFPEEIRAEPRTEAVLESRVYVPIVAWVNRLADRVASLHAGNIHAYLLTMFATLLVLLIVGGYAR